MEPQLSNTLVVCSESQPSATRSREQVLRHRDDTPEPYRAAEASPVPNDFCEMPCGHIAAVFDDGRDLVCCQCHQTWELT